MLLIYWVYHYMYKVYCERAYIEYTSLNGNQTTVQYSAYHHYQDNLSMIKKV